MGKIVKAAAMAVAMGLAAGFSAPALSQSNVERQINEMNRSLNNLQREQAQSRQQQIENNSLRMQIDRNAATPPPFSPPPVIIPKR